MHLMNLFKYMINYYKKNSKAVEKLYCWGEALDPNFQKEMLSILKEEKLENEK